MRRLGLVIGLLACSKTEPPTVDKPAAVAKHEDRHDPAAPATLQLDITVGGTTTTWHQDAFAKVPRMAGVASDGEARDTWSLRELAHQLVGPTARVTAVIGAEGSKPLDAGTWADAARTPILHTTRRGTLKFRWADAAGKWGETEVKEVLRLELVP